MKKYQVCLLGLVWGLVAIQGILNMTTKNDYKLVEAFESSETIPIEGKVTVSGSLGEEELDEKTKKNLLVDLAKEMGLTKDYTIDTVEKDGAHIMTLKKEGKTGSVWFRITSVDTTNYLTTEIALENAKEVFSLRQHLEAVMQKHGMKTSSTLYLRGDFEKILTKKEKKKIEAKIFDILDAKEVLRYDDEYSDTIYGYSSLLSEHYERNGEKINLQMILQYNEANENTQLYLAVPFYNESY